MKFITCIALFIATTFAVGEENAAVAPAAESQQVQEVAKSAENAENKENWWNPNPLWNTPPFNQQNNPLWNTPPFNQQNNPLWNTPPFNQQNNPLWNTPQFNQQNNPLWNTPPFNQQNNPLWNTPPFNGQPATSAWHGAQCWNNQKLCDASGGYLECVHDKLELRPCAPGTACSMQTGVANCDNRTPTLIH